MFKNFRVGNVKYYDKGTHNKPGYLFIEVIEECNGQREVYYATYNLYIEIDRRYTGLIDSSCVGKWIMFGFYVQSFYDGKNFYTLNKIRHYEEIEEGDTIVNVDIKNSRLIHSDGVREISVPMNALNVIRAINKHTTFHENMEIDFGYKRK